MTPTLLLRWMNYDKEMRVGTGYGKMDPVMGCKV